MSRWIPGISFGLRENMLDAAGLDEVVIEQISAALWASVEQNEQTFYTRDLTQPQMINISLETPLDEDECDEVVASERLLAVADLYYLYQHELMGVFKTVQRLQDRLPTGALPVPGNGAFALFHFDLRETLYYTQHDRWAAYRRAFGGADESANRDFRPLFQQFVRLIARGTWAADVRCAGWELRDNLQQASSGRHVHVLRGEVLRLLDDALCIVNADDIKRLFGAESGCGVIDAVLARKGVLRRPTAPRQQMARAGRALLRWLAQPYILDGSHDTLKTQLCEMMPVAQEWLTGARALRQKHGYNQRE